jgi:hypothetical protein
MLHGQPNIKLIRTNLRRQWLVIWMSGRSHTCDVFSQCITTVTVQDILMHEANLGSPKLCSGCNNIHYFHLFLAYLTTLQKLRVRVVEREADHWTGRRLDRFCRDTVSDTLECSWRDAKRPHKTTYTQRQVAVNLDTRIWTRKLTITNKKDRPGTAPL